jgi:hypothetical protein
MLIFLFLGFVIYNPVYFGKKVKKEKVKKVVVYALCIHCGVNIVTNQYAANFFRKK